MATFIDYLRHHGMSNAYNIFDHVIKELDADDIFWVQYTDSKPKNKHDICDPIHGYMISWSSETVFSASILTHCITPAEVYSWMRWL